MKGETWYKLEFMNSTMVRITPIEVMNETADFVYVKTNGRVNRTAKLTQFQAIFKTRNEARNHAIEAAKIEVERARSHMETALKRVGAAENLAGDQ